MGSNSGPPQTYEQWQNQPEGQKKKNAPPPQDYKGAAEQQAASSANAVNAQTQANRPDINTTFGGFQQWTKDANGNYHLSAGLGGPLGDVANSLSGQAQSAMGSPLDFGSLPKIGSGDSARDQAITGAYDQAKSRLDPRFNQEEQQLRTQLINQGLDPNSEAAQREMANFGRTKNDAYSSAMNGAIAQGTAAQQATFGQNVLAHNTALADALRQRELPIEELQGLQGFMGVPGFNAAGQAQATQYLPAAMALGNYQLTAADMNNRAQGQMFDAYGNAMGNLGSLAMFAG